MAGSADTEVVRSRTTTYAYLEHYPEQGGPPARVLLLTFPFGIGRMPPNDHVVFSVAVSKQHAVLLRSGDDYVLRDLRSTNGTFVNGLRVIEDRCLVDGDIIHFGPVEFCFQVRSLDDTATLPIAEENATVPVAQAAPQSLIRSTERLRELIEVEAVEILYQPIVNLADRSVVAYEALGRGTHPALSRSPAALLHIADRCGLSVTLSQLFRRLAVQHAAQLPAGKRVFLNIHPQEMIDFGFLESLEELQRHRHPDHPLVLEIAEASVTNVDVMAHARDAFTKLGLEFAYDDFGAGQARLLELSDIPPHFLKLDMAVIRDIETVRPRQEVLKALLSVVQTLGVRAIAEGIETESCAVLCRDIGCQWGQGYLFGRPGPAVMD